MNIKILNGRVLGVLLFFLAIWPLSSILLAPCVLYVVDLFKSVPIYGLMAGAVMVTAAMSVELLVIGGLLASLTCVVIRICGPLGDTINYKRGLIRGILDALTIAIALFTGIALELPAVLWHPTLTLLRPAPVWLVTTLLLCMAVVMAVFMGRRTTSRGSVPRAITATLSVLVLGWGLVRFVPMSVAAGGAADQQRILLGLDSLSVADDLEPLKTWSESSGGLFHKIAVTPGLLTNSVWPSLISSQRPSQLGSYFIFQAPDWQQLGSNLVLRANQAGLATYSYFSDQFTVHVGSDLPFSENHSGPRGWRQPLSAAVKDASIFLPVILPWLPELPGAGSPVNQSGTFAFSLRRELGDIFGGARASGSSLVLAHIDYLHQARFPGYSELNWQQRIAVLHAPLAGVADKSIDWQYPKSESDPIGLYKWKVKHLLDCVTQVAGHTGLLAADKRTQLVIFSDHGARTGIKEGDFAHPKYYQVPLVTFGISRKDLAKPVSIMDLPAWIGLEDPQRPAPFPLVVEYANVTGEEWAVLVGNSRPMIDGAINLYQPVLKKLGRRLLAADVSMTTPVYQTVAVEPVINKPAAPSVWSRFMAFTAR